MMWWLLILMPMLPLPETDETAEAEMPSPYRTVHVDALEINSAYVGGTNQLDQVVFWSTSYCKEERRWVVVDRGWCRQEAAMLTEIEGKPAAVIQGRSLIVTADVVFWSETTLDPELTLRDETFHITN